MAEARRAEQPAAAKATTPAGGGGAGAVAAALGSATYEIIRQRLEAQGALLCQRMGRLDERRREVFGSVEYKLLQADRIVTSHNCIPRDMIPIGHGRFLFGFNVQFGLKKEIELGDVFALYDRDEAAGAWKEADLGDLRDPRFVTDFKRLYNVYEKTAFQKFTLRDGALYMVFSTGTGASDVAVFKWIPADGRLKYVDGRAEAEYRRIGYLPPHEFKWITPNREAYRYGDHPHVSVADRVFVECTGGDLTIKVEDNTSTGEGIYSEPVEDKFQKVDDAEIAYGLVGHLIVLKIRPYKEQAARYFVFNEKTQTAVRVDSIGQSCVLLPEEHGLIFPDGYYLAAGELKRFECDPQGMSLDCVFHAPNGEDTLYAFHNRRTGEYALLPYRLIRQKVEERISCHGFSLFPNGQLVLFHAEPEPQRHHMIQLRQTPFYQPGHEPVARKDAFLYQVGNKDVVRCLAECHEVLVLVRQQNPYAELYTDLVKRCGAILDSYPWLVDQEGFGVNEALRNLREAADKAVEEFDKVRRLQREAVERVKTVRGRCAERLQALRRASFSTLNEYVQNLAALRQLRGELITLKELRYVDLAAVTETEQQVTEQTEQLSGACVKFLLKPEALQPYRQQAAEQLAQADKITKTAQGRALEKSVATAAGELEMLIEIVNSLKIEDATETTRIIDSITAVYSTLNQVKAALKKRLQSLLANESAAQFAAQLKLLSQAAASYLDLCDSPAKCDEYLNRLSVQIEELEGAFADFEQYTVQLAERRTELYEAFEQRKIALVEQRSRKSNALLVAAERILKVIRNRLAGFKSAEQINTYMASDLMIAKVRETIAQLLELGDSVKADDLQGRLKSAQQEALRQLRDRQELFAGGENLIRFGKHQFNINTQTLDLTVVHRDDTPFVHLTSTKYFDPITDEVFLATRQAWDQEVVSEDPQVYRAEYLAWQLLRARDGSTRDDVDPLVLAQQFISTRYQEGYAKGIHDHDAALIYKVLRDTHVALQLARYAPAARACALVYWHRFCPAETRSLWTAKLKGISERNKLFAVAAGQQDYITGLAQLLARFVEETKLFEPELAGAAAEYLFHELTGGDKFVLSREASLLVAQFRRHLAEKGSAGAFEQGRAALRAHPVSEFGFLRDWVRGFLHEKPEAARFQEIIAAVLFAGEEIRHVVVNATLSQVIDGLKGSHPRVNGSRYQFDYLDFQGRLQRFEQEMVPRFQRYQQIKQELLHREQSRLRLHEFRPNVLSSFVRNQLIDQVYLPLIGDNLAKQIGAAGDAKRTDLMGLLLVISPPGYGKTTLVEYIANRLGLVFVKINGPTLGHGVTSLDPTQAPNAAAREEIHKLNLALEMGDNVMLCIDDIQHCNPEFLQKFISLCDAQRKIDGVWRGQPRTYDLRGRKVVVVMAGNPYTESGQKFKIPDMLANRADTYNLGDIIGGNPAWFKASYIENAVTSNAVLAPLARKSQADVRAFIRLAEANEQPTEPFEGSYSAQEIEEILGVMRKLVAIREIVMRVNQEYIASAAQADEFRTEPPFRLQGSYRNMNRLAEKIVPIMNDTEVRALVIDHYRGESQTLTTGAEANLLKFKELIGALSDAEKTRWDEIKRTFRRNQVTRGADQGDPVGRVVAQLAAFQAGLESIQQTIANHATKPPASPSVVVDLEPVGRVLAALQTQATTQKLQSLTHEMEMLHKTVASLQEMAAQQRDHLRKAQELLETRAKQGVVEFDLTKEMLSNQEVFLEQFYKKLDERNQQQAATNPPPAQPPTGESK